MGDNGEAILGVIQLGTAWDSCARLVLGTVAGRYVVERCAAACRGYGIQRASFFQSSACRSAMQVLDFRYGGLGHVRPRPDICAGLAHRSRLVLEQPSPSALAHLFHIQPIAGFAHLSSVNLLSSTNALSGNSRLAQFDSAEQ